MPITLPSDAMLTRNITRTYRSATQAQIDAGKDWYANAYALAAELDPENIRKAAAIIAVLSPMQKWPRNVFLARELYEKGTCGGSLGTAKAIAIYNGGDPDVIVSGPKVTVFWYNILGQDAPATIDRHAFDIACGVRYGDDARPLGAKNIARMQAAYARAAKILGQPVHAVQAVTWTVWVEKISSRRGVSRRAA